MSPVELLRAAAAELRATAAGASEGPWETGEDGLVWTQKPIPGDPVSGSTEPEDAAWIALMHPGLAEPLAALLDRQADLIQIQCKDFPPDLRDEIVREFAETFHTPSLRVARALLGVPDGR